MAKTNVTLSVGDTFPPGTKVEAHPRIVDTLTSPPVSKAAGTATVDANGNVTFKGLVKDGPYFVTGRTKVTVVQPRSGQGTKEIDRFGWSAFTATADTPEEVDSPYVRQYEAEQKAALEVRKGVPDHAATPGLQPQAPGTGPTVKGARNSVNARSRGDSEPQPHPRIEHHQGERLRSHTPLGELHPVDPREPLPKPTQDDVSKRTPQRSDTSLGEATPVDKPEAVPAKRQEDQRGRQRSDTKTGTAEPKPRAPARKAQRVRESSRSKARGATVPKAGTSKKSSRASARKQSSTSKKGK